MFLFFLEQKITKKHRKIEEKGAVPRIKKLNGASAKLCASASARVEMRVAPKERYGSSAHRK